MEKKHRTTPSNPAVGHSTNIWTHLFTFLKVRQRFAIRSLCTWFKHVLEQPESWRFVEIVGDSMWQEDEALVRLRRTVKMEISKLELSPMTGDAVQILQWGIEKLMTPQLRELVIRPDSAHHSSAHTFVEVSDWRPCFNSLRLLEVPWCIALKNSALLVQLQGLRSFQWTAIDGIRNCDENKSEEKNQMATAMDVLAKGLVPRLHHLGLSSSHSDNNGYSTDITAARVFLPAAVALRSLEFCDDDNDGNEPQNRLWIDRPGLQELVCAGVRVYIAESTAKTLVRWKHRFPGVLRFDDLPVFPLLEEADLTDFAVEYSELVLHKMIAKMPRLTKFTANIFPGETKMRENVWIQGIGMSHLFTTWVLVNGPKEGFPIMNTGRPAEMPDVDQESTGEDEY